MFYAISSSSAKTQHIVEEVLTKDNYAQWRVCIKQFLKSEGLWEVCKVGPPLERVPDPQIIWKKKKNDMALHVIKNSCSPEMLSHIKTIEFANVAWETLNRIANPTPELTPDAPPPTGTIFTLPLVKLACRALP